MNRKARVLVAGAVTSFAAAQLVVGVQWAAPPAPPPAPSAAPVATVRVVQPTPNLPQLPDEHSPQFRVQPAIPAAPQLIVPARPSAVAPPLQPTAGLTPAGRAAFQFTGPSGLKVSWQVAGGAFHDRDLAVPAAFNFTRGQTYRLRLSGHPRFPERAFYPTLEVAAPNAAADRFLDHSAVPLAFSDAELLAAADGKFIEKAIVYGGYSHDAKTLHEVTLNRDGSSANDRSQPGLVLATVRLGSIDLENPHSPPLAAPPGMDVPPTPAVAPLPRAVADQ